MRRGTRCRPPATGSLCVGRKPDRRRASAVALATAGARAGQEEPPAASPLTLPALCAGSLPLPQGEREWEPALGRTSTRGPLTLVCLGCGRRSVELVGHAPPARRPSDRSPSDALRVAANHRLGARSAAVPSFTRTVAWARARTCKAGTHGLWHSTALLSASTYRRNGSISGLRR